MILALDTETLGFDFDRGVKPFLVTTCADNGEQHCFEWDVIPTTRQPNIDDDDLIKIKSLVESADRLVLHNAKFDKHALDTIIPDLKWDWSKVEDTITMAHVLESNRPKDLTALAMRYLSEDIEPLEKALDNLIKDECHKYAKKHFPNWRLAQKGLKDMPSIKRTPYKADMWLPKAIAKARDYPKGHPYWTVLSDYANKDSEITLMLMLGGINSRGEVCLGMEEILHTSNLWDIYKFRLQGIRLAYDMECRGITMDGEQTKQLYNKYSKDSEELGKKCVSIAEQFNYDLELPKRAANNSLRTFILDVMKLEPQYNKKTEGPSIDKAAKKFYVDTLPSGSKELEFMKALSDKGNADGSLGYIEQYRKFWIRNQISNNHYILYPDFNPTSTSTLRWGSENPNAQNIKKDPDDDGFSLRSCFGPAPGREWWSLDAKNIELRIPFYESGEPAMIDLFERENEPPFYGSYHMLMFSILWPKIWDDAIKKVGSEHAAEYCKKEYKHSYYQWTKNFDFCVQYGSGETNADITAHLPGAYKLTNQRFAKLAALNTKYVNLAKQNGYVETLPDRSINPNRGYPLLCSRTDWGDILPTTPLNYHVSGSAMWLTQKAMIRTDAQLNEWRREGFDGFMTIQVHDELVLDFPKKAHPKVNPSKSNLARARIIQQLMSSCGDDFVPSLPTPFGLEYHDENWSKGLAL